MGDSLVPKIEHMFGNSIQWTLGSAGKGKVNCDVKQARRDGAGFKPAPTMTPTS